MHATANLRVVSAALQIRGIHENETIKVSDVKMTDAVPELQHSLSDTLVLEEHENIRDLN